MAESVALRDSLSDGRTSLVVVVDIDDDIGRVLGSSLIVGLEEVMRAAYRYGTLRPEDPDLNAMFAGIKLYRELEERGYRVEIAVVGGHSQDSLKAQSLVKDRVREVVESLGGYVEFYLVSDGEEELVVAELLRDIGPIAGIKRVIVEQHLGIESNYILFIRYLKKALAEPQLSRYTLGIPGLIVAVASLLSIAGLLSLALKVAALIAGVAMLVYGFNLEPYVAEALQRLRREVSDVPHIKVAGLVLLGVMAAAGLGFLYYYYSIGDIQLLVAGLIRHTIPLILAGAVLYIVINKVIGGLIKGDVGMTRYISSILILGFSSLAFYSLGSYMAASLDAGYPLASVLIDSIFQSRFVQYMLAGVGLAGIIELLSRGDVSQ